MQKDKKSQKSKGGLASPIVLIVGFVIGLIAMSLVLAVLGALLPM